MIKLKQALANIIFPRIVAISLTNAIGGVIVAGAAGASIWTNNKVKENSGGVYDVIMKLMGL